MDYFTYFIICPLFVYALLVILLSYLDYAQKFAYNKWLHDKYPLLFKLNKAYTILIIMLVFYFGTAKAGIETLLFFLPNDWGKEYAGGFESFKGIISLPMALLISGVNIAAFHYAIKFFELRDEVAKKEESKEKDNYED